MAKAPKRKPQKADLRALIRRRYDSNAWALFEEVRNAAGFKATRSADAIAMSLWPSRGLHVHGMEIKSSRADWLNELKRPEKSEPFMKYCDFWWLVADKGVALESEIPKTWGFMSVHGSGLRVVKDAPKLKSKQLDCSFVAVLLKNAQEQAKRPENEIRAKMRDELQKEFDDELEDRVRRQAGSKVWILERQIENLETELKALRDAEEKAGMAIHHWELDRYASALKSIGYITNGKDTTLEHVVKQLSVSLEAAQSAAAMINDLRARKPGE